MARFAICTLLLVCAALPAAEKTNLRTPGDAIEVVDFYARATLILPTGGVQANGDAAAASVVQVLNGAYHISAVADPQNRLRESPRNRTNNKRFIVLIAATSPPDNQIG